MRPCGIIAVSLCLLCVASVLAAGKKPKAKKKPAPSATEPAAAIDSFGMPTMLPRDGTRIYVWQDGTSWHLRTNSGLKGRKFSGILKLPAGKVTKLSGLEGLERTGKARDIGRLRRDKKLIEFAFTTDKTGIDGFDFEVDAEVKAIVFDLKVDGYAQPGIVVVGKNKQPAPTGVFELPVVGPFSPSVDGDATSP